MEMENKIHKLKEKWLNEEPISKFYLREIQYDNELLAIIDFNKNFTKN